MSDPGIVNFFVCWEGFLVCKWRRAKMCGCMMAILWLMSTPYCDFRKLIDISDLRHCGEAFCVCEWKAKIQWSRNCIFLCLLRSICVWKGRRAKVVVWWQFCGECEWNKTSMIFFEAKGLYAEFTFRGFVFSGVSKGMIFLIHLDSKVVVSWVFFCFGIYRNVLCCNLVFTLWWLVDDFSCVLQSDCFSNNYVLLYFHWVLCSSLL